MKYWAKVLDNKILQVIVAEEEFFDTFIDSSPGEWIETTKDNYAGIRYTYDSENNAFYSPQPYPSWILDKENFKWNPPIPFPEDGYNYLWNEDNKEWEKIEE
jgi:hypothetical protein